MQGPPSHSRSFDPLALAIAVAIAVLGFLPVANWLTGGHHAPWYAPVASTWVTGSALAIGIGLSSPRLSENPVLLHDGSVRASYALDRSPAVCWPPSIRSVVVTVIAHLVFDPAAPRDESSRCGRAISLRAYLTTPVGSHPRSSASAPGRGGCNAPSRMFPPGHSALLMRSISWRVVDPRADRRGPAVAALGFTCVVAERTDVSLRRAAALALAPLVPSFATS